MNSASKRIRSPPAISMVIVLVFRLMASPIYYSYVFIPNGLLSENQRFPGGI